MTDDPSLDDEAFLSVLKFRNICQEFEVRVKRSQWDVNVSFYDEVGAGPLAKDKIILANTLPMHGMDATVVNAHREWYRMNLHFSNCHGI